MIRLILPLLLSVSLFSKGQNNTATTDSFPKVATVNVTVTDMKIKPRKGEQVVFRGEKNGKLFMCVSDAAGKAKQTLPPDDTYFVSVKSISDTTKYTTITIPALAEDEYFTDPFWVNIKFDPPRHYLLDHVHFDTDKATLRPDSFLQLKELLEYLQRHDEIGVEIGGHTDNAGSDAHNLTLSQERANTIRNYLLQKGIKASRVTAKGYGASQPAADNNTEEGRQLNRRTEVRVL